MDLQQGAAVHVGKIIIKNGFNRTITLNSDLWVDVLE
jgi:hypothetical protein